MIALTLNDEPSSYDGDPKRSLLSWLREERGLTSAKDGCSGQAACGACLVEVDGHAALSCSTPMGKLQGASVVTIEGFPEGLRRTLGSAFAAKGAVQCGFCTPGFLARTKIFLQGNANPTRDEAVAALRFHLCRCTGYVKIVDAVLEAAAALREGRETPLCAEAGVGGRLTKLHAYDRAVGQKPFVDDLRFAGMVHGALVFSEHPRAEVVAIEVTPALACPGVIRTFTAADIPGRRNSGMLVQDWPLMLEQGETTRYIGDVLAGVVAETEAQAREAASRIRVRYRPQKPLTEMIGAAQSTIKVHTRGNVLASHTVRRGEPVDAVLDASAHVASGVFSTQMVEHGFLETECAVALPEAGGIRVYSQGQAIYHDREHIAAMLGLPLDKVRVSLVDAGGAFGGKEDMSVQGHAALFAHALGRPVKVKFNRAESLRFHPKRHPMRLEYAVGCDAAGKLTAIRARILGDTGAYASLGGPVIGRAATHAGGAYHVPNVDIEATAVYTNNIPCGAMRGFGVNQVTFAMESLVEELCSKGGFDPWQFRYDNALDEGLLTATGQRLGGGIGLRKTLLAVREQYRSARHAGLSMAMKNCGFGNGVVEACTVKLAVGQGGRITLHHGWSEMGQGINTVAAQILCEALGIRDASLVEVVADTAFEAPAGSTTASRGTFQLGRAVLDAAGALRAAGRPEDLAGRIFTGHYLSDDTTSMDSMGEPGRVRSHVAYSFATHLAVLDDAGRVRRVVAAHDSGRVINPTLFEGQVEGGVAMGLGYALTERFGLDKGQLVSEKLSHCGMLKAQDMPVIEVIAVEAVDPEGPCGAKGVGEIGSIPTAAAVGNAFFRFDGVPRRDLPLKAPTGGGL